MPAPTFVGFGNVLQGHTSLLAPLQVAGAPTSGTSGTFAKIAAIGARLIDITNGILYINTNTQASPTWTKVGTQT